MSIKERVLVVRPYGERVRARVFALLERAGLEIATDEVIAEGTPDAEAIRAVLASRCSVLLVPFHGHRTASGQALDGLGLMSALEQASPERRLRVLMPVSQFGAASVALARETGALPANVLVLPEDELDRPETVRRVVAHLAARP